MRRPPIPVALPTALALSALVAGAVAVPAHAEPSGGPEVAVLQTAAGTAAGVHDVRLITGDTVVVSGSGEKATVAFRPDADNPTGTARIVRHGKDITVIPEEAQPLLDAGVLDERLFDVDALIEQGYADGRDLALIVQNADGSADAPEAAARTRALPSVKGLAAKVKAKDTGRMWAGLRDRSEGATGAKLADGVRHVWLDGQVKAQLDVSVPQIGAPTAWSAGYDGTGVKVAVLDTGIDATHPDVAGAIVEARNFSTSADAVDRHGHGTHVASTIAGSGAASGGRYKGVAPKARLLVGKVLGDNGSGSDSNVLAGMEWAARSGAQVVSMSLGASIQSDGSDPMSTAVDNLTAETGALFVIAAGNAGPDATTLGSPGVADAALTVAAVDKQDRMASFSSRGPRFGDAALKPDIAAPGVDIVAARAAGTTMGMPVGASYTGANGTSMATPHVAGAAAILAQRRPDWTAADLKGALMASAKVLDHSAFAEGSGRVDIPAALEETVWATNASFGRFAYGQQVGALNRTVTFHNTADHDVVLSLSASMKHESGTVVTGALALGADTVTVPAHGTKDVAVTATPDATTTGGAYTGTITATGDGVTAHATVAFLREPKQVTVTIRATMPDGSPVVPGASFILYNLRSNNPPKSIRFGSNSVATFKLPAGRYTTLGTVRGVNGAYLTFAFPDIFVAEDDITLTVDSARAQQIKLTTPRPYDAGALGVSIGRRSDEQDVGIGVTLAGVDTQGKNYAVPTAAPKDGTFDFTKFFILRSEVQHAEALLADSHLDLLATAFNGAELFDGSRSLRVADAGSGSAADLAAGDVEGKLALVRIGSESLYTVLDRVTAARPAAIAVVNKSDVRGAGFYSSALPVFAVPNSRGLQLADAVAAAAEADDSVVVRLDGGLDTGYGYQLIDAEPGGVDADQTYAPTAADLATVHVVDRVPGPDVQSASLTQEAWAGLSLSTGVGLGLFPAFQMGSSRTIYLSTEDVVWNRMATVANAGPFHTSQTMSYTAGAFEEQPWFSAPMHPGTNADSGAQPYPSRPFRDKTGLRASFNLWNSADGRSGENTGGAVGDTKSFRVYVDGQLVGTAGSPSVLIKNAPSARAEYRFELDEARSAKWWASGARSHTAWSFFSAAPDGDDKVDLPILEADYDLADVDRFNAVAAGHKHDLALRFRMAGLPVRLTKATIEASYDGGATWTAQTVERGDATARTVLDVPASATSVSLRVSGTDASGAAITQTLIDSVRVS